MGRKRGVILPILFIKVGEKALMASQIFCTNSSLSITHSKSVPLISTHTSAENIVRFSPKWSGRKLMVQCSENQTQILRTCKNCKTQFDPLLNHPRSCRFHTAHFGGSISLSLSIENRDMYSLGAYPYDYQLFYFLNEFVAFVYLLLFISFGLSFSFFYLGKCLFCWWFCFFLMILLLKSHIAAWLLFL